MLLTWLDGRLDDWVDTALDAAVLPDATVLLEELDTWLDDFSDAALDTAVLKEADVPLLPSVMLDFPEDVDATELSVDPANAAYWLLDAKPFDAALHRLLKVDTKSASED